MLRTNPNDHKQKLEIAMTGKETDKHFRVGP